MLKLPPITVMMKRYIATAVVRMALGARSTMMAVVTPTHISPMTLDGMRDRKHQGLGRKRAPAANGAAAAWEGKGKSNIGMAHSHTSCSTVFIVNCT